MTMMRSEIVPFSLDVIPCIYKICLFVSIKVSQSLSKTLMFNLPHHNWNIILVAQDGVIQPYSLSASRRIITIYLNYVDSIFYGNLLNKFIKAFLNQYTSLK